MKDLIAMILGVILLLLIVWVCAPALTGKHVSKGSLIKSYQVDNRTFQGWVDKLMPSYASAWKSKRKVSAFEEFAIHCVFGDPTEFPVLNKAGIIAKLKEDELLPAAEYRFLRMRLQIHVIEPQLVGLSTFPPKIAKRLFLMAQEV